MTIWLSGGDYERTNALQLRAEDSGSARAPVIWRARPGQTVRWLGGRSLGDFEPVRDPAILARLREGARQHVLQMDLRVTGVVDFPGLQSRGFARPTTPSHVELFYAGKPMTLARWPNEGSWETIAGFPEESATPDGHGGKIGNLQTGFFYTANRPAEWQDATNIWVHGYWAWDWANSYEQIAELNAAQKWVKTAPPYGHYGFRKGQRVYFLNILEELDEPGEWFLDRRTGVLYFWPPDLAPVKPNTSPARAEALISLLGEPLLRMNDVTNVEVRGIVFEASRGNGIEIHGGASNTVAGCTLRNLGNYGVMVTGGFGSRVLSCDVFHTGDGGVSLEGGDRKTLTPGGHRVENTHFRWQGRWSKCYVPAVLMGGVGMSALRNLIHDHPHCGILYNGNDHLIEGNEIHHIALETGDVGAIYTGRDYTYRGNRIRYNYIHHTGGVGMGSMGVYMDDCVSGAEIRGNIFYRVHRAAFLGGGRDHQVLNNVFVECEPAVELDGRGLDTSPVWRSMVDQIMRDRLRDVPLSLYRERYPAMRALDDYYGPPGGPAIEGASFKGVPPERNLVQRNVCVGNWLKVGWHASTNMLVIENNLVDANPLFTGPIDAAASPEAFQPKKISPVWKLGFERIPADRIGLYRDDYRRKLPERR